MLTRLKVDGFKNLVDVDVRFGPFCVAGANGVGKSNLLDAIAFLSKLNRPLVDAALSVRDEAGRTGDVRNLFHRVGKNYAGKIPTSPKIGEKWGHPSLFGLIVLAFLRRRNSEQADSSVSHFARASE